MARKKAIETEVLLDQKTEQDASVMEQIPMTMVADIATKDASKVKNQKSVKGNGDKPELRNFSFASWLQKPEDEIVMSANSIITGRGRVDETTLSLMMYGFISYEQMQALANADDVASLKRAITEKFLTEQIAHVRPMRIAYNGAMPFNNGFYLYDITSFTYDAKDIVKTFSGYNDLLRPVFIAICEMKIAEIKQGKFKSKTEEVLTSDNPLYDRCIKKLNSMIGTFKSDKSTWKDVVMASNGLSFLAPGFKPKGWDHVRL